MIVMYRGLFALILILSLTGMAQAYIPTDPACRVLDNFEGYTTLAGSNWTNAANTTITLVTNESHNTSNDPSATKSMKVQFSGTFSAAAIYTYPESADYSGTADKVLSLWYLCDEKTVSISVTLTDTSSQEATVLLNTSSSPVPLIRSGSWENMNTRLTDFTSVNPLLDLGLIKTLTITIVNNLASGQSGVISFDDIELCDSRCLPKWLGDPGDINDDCIVDEKDLKLMADDWLKTSSWSGIADPNGWDGILHNFDGTQWVTGGKYGGALELPGFPNPNDADIPGGWVEMDQFQPCNRGGTDPNGFYNLSISMWVKVEVLPAQYVGDREITRVDFIGNEGGDGKYYLEIGMYPYGGTIRARFGPYESPNPKREELWSTKKVSEMLNSWYHIALTIKNNGDGTSTAKLWLHGSVGKRDDGNPSTTAKTVTTVPTHYGNRLLGLNLGSYVYQGERTGFVHAKIDDFRIYNVALNEPPRYNFEIMMITVGTYPSDVQPILKYDFNELSGNLAQDSGTSANSRVYHANGSPANLDSTPNYNGNDIIDSIDYSHLAENWMKQALWP